MDHIVEPSRAKTTPIHALTRKAFRAWKSKQSKATTKWIKVNGFKAADASILLVPGRDGAVARVLIGLGDGGSVWSYAGLPKALPQGRYRIEGGSGDEAALGWALGTYRFDRYRESTTKFATLVWPEDADRGAVTRSAEGIALARDLINTPASDMGPAQLADAAKALAKQHGAKCKTVSGKALVEGYPAIHAVGRASAQAPRLVDLRWGPQDAPKLTLVGKGVCFDSGGLDLKSAAGMKLMKKDMGGAASVLALAHAVMDAKLNVHLRVLIPAVENAVSGDAYRPSDVLSTRRGLTVEVGNTDAEGRLVLCDALADAADEEPDLLIDFATLTGAARVALGTELPALFCDDDEVSESLLRAGKATGDPLWRMPLHDAYDRHLRSHVADLNNMSNVPQGGAITAALFLRKFVEGAPRWVHIDTMGWNLNSRPGRPVGGEAFGVRAAFVMLDERYGRQAAAEA